jgi:hypothetical protein
MREGHTALAAGDVGRAAEAWGGAVALAARLRHKDMLVRLSRLVDIQGDPADGVVLVKPNLRPREIFSAMLGSLKSTHSPDAIPARPTSGPAEASDRLCPNCGYKVSPSAKFCGKCQQSLGETA